MSTAAIHSISNQFLAGLPPGDVAALQPHLERLPLPAHTVLHEIGRPIEHCYFLDHGMASLVVPLNDGVTIEAGVVGKEGFAGGAALMGAQDAAPQTTMIQMEGAGLRIGAKILRDEALRRPALLDRVHRFTQALNVQIAHTAACNAHHDIPERLARWLLMALDRADSSTLPLTQDFLSMMLGVRRPGVTAAAQALQATGAIEYERGRIVVLDRQALEGAACECYAMVREHYHHVLGWPAAKEPGLR